jgi:hypothetical protein
MRPSTPASPCTVDTTTREPEPDPQDTATSAMAVLAALITIFGFATGVALAQEERAAERLRAERDACRELVAEPVVCVCGGPAEVVGVGQ